MKKLVLFSLFLLFIKHSNAQALYLSETFSGTTLPTGWTNNDIAGSGEIWEFNNPGGRTINAPVSGNFAIFDSDNGGLLSPAEEAALESPSFNTTGGYNKVILQFDHYYNDNGSTDTAYVEVFNGSSWVTVATYNADTPNATREFIDITAQALNVTNAKIRFRYVGNYDWWWAVDNVSVFSPPNNDDCANAENLPIGRVFNDFPVSGSNTYSLNLLHVSTPYLDPTCGNFGNGYDTWYKVTIPSGGNLAVEVRNQNGTPVDDTVIQSYTGSCGSLILLSCDDDSGEGFYSRLKFTGRTPGEVIYIRIFEFSNDQLMDFTISAFTCFRNPKYWDGTNWRRVKDGVIATNPPNIDTETRIEGNYNTTANGSFSTCSCEVKTGNTLTINSNEYVEVDKELINDGAIVINNNGSLVQNDNAATVTGAGTYSMQRISTPLNNVNDYTYWSSPMTSHTLANMITTTHYYDFNAAIQDWNWQNGATNMSVGKGYIAKAITGTTSGSTNAVTFSGAPYNTGIITTNMQFTTVVGTPADDSWNLIGNPYPSAIDANALVTHNATMNGTLYFWTHITPLNASGTSYASSDYATWNATGSVGTAATSTATGNGNTNAPTGFIAAGQAFFAQANTTGNIEFTNAMRVTTGNDNFYRVQNNNADRIWLNLTNAQEAFKQQLIGFLPDATDGVDRLYDGLVNNGNSYINFYSLANNDKYVILANDLIDTEEIILLGYESSIATTFTISIDHLSGDLNTDTFDIYLKDLDLNIVHNLKESDYQFTTGIGTFDSRFELFIQRSSALTVHNELLTNDELLVSQLNNADFVIKTANNAMIKEVQVFNTLGQLLVKTSNEQEVISIHLETVSRGNLLLFKVQTVAGNSYTKKILKIN